MRKKQPTERDFQRAVIAAYNGVISQIDAGVGTTVGFPDTVALTDWGWLPLELKVGTIAEGVLWCSEVRASQIRWHDRANSEGGVTAFLVGVWFGDRWRVFLINSTIIEQYDTTGFKLEQEAIELDMQNLYTTMSIALEEFQ